MSMSMRECIDTAHLVEAADAVLSGVFAFRARFPTLTKALFGTPPVQEPTFLGPVLLQTTGPALRKSVHLTNPVCNAAASSGPTFVQILNDLDNELATFVRPNGKLLVALGPVEENLSLAPAA